MRPGEVPVEEVRAIEDAVAQLVGDVANRLLGLPTIGTEEWGRQYGERDTTAGRARSKDWHLMKIAIEARTGVRIGGDVSNARRHGASWQEIGRAAGITRQAAHERWSKLDEFMRADAAAGVYELYGPPVPASDHREDP